MKDLFIDDYELVDQTEKENSKACGGCEFRHVYNCLKITSELCLETENFDKVWKIKLKQNEKNN